ncbi:MAG: ABC transporter ATP-binding protein/permease [Propionibacteriaceae bacterium]|jgi:ATP-binding cassette subfamily B protein|nr:ABC transporter ATP-binding protein/permease [Propionibacteriaceae bacterium]
MSKEQDKEEKEPSKKVFGQKDPNFGKENEKPKNAWATIKRLAGYTKKNVLLIVLAFVATIAGTVMQVYSPKRTGDAVTVIFEGIRSGQGIDFHALLAILLTVALLFVGIFLANFLQQRLMVLVAQKATYRLRKELKAKMNKVPVSYFDKHTNGNLMSIAANDVDNIVTNLQESLTTLISSVILLVGYLTMMLLISPILTLITAAIIPFSLILMGLITPAAKKYTTAYYTGLGELSTNIEESYQGFAVVKTFNGEEAILKQFDGSNETMVVQGRKARFLGGTMMPTMSLGSNIVYVLIAVIGALKVISGQIAIGDITAFFQYSSGFSQPIMKILQSWGNVLAMLASAERVFEVLDAEEMDDAPKDYPNDTDDPAKVSFDHVQFGYGDDLLMHDFCLDVAPGQMIAIVGHTGAGKTTLINLLERFYDIKGGSIRIDGVDTRNMTPDELRSRIGMVLQDTWLFSGTIYDNIKYGNESATDEQIHAAAKAAYADDFITKLPDGYDTILNEEADNISQGQRQLITIARAFVSDPEILILDEATSNVDSRTEMVIQSAMKRLLNGRTSFVVAHRLSTIYDADRILVMDAGDIVETGDHEELQAMGGVYADIYNSQFALATG